MHLLLIACVSVVYGIGSVYSVVSAQEQSAGEENLSGINWDEEEAASQTGGTKEENLSGINWDEEEATAEDSEDPATMDWGEADEPGITEEEERIAAQKAEDRKALEKREFRIHVWGFFLFAFYLIGIAYTAYFTRNRKIAVHYAPELLIILHMLWPLQWLSLLFAGQKVK